MTHPTMFIVDDDEELAQIVRLCGEGMGFDVQSANSGAGFREMIEQNLPDVVVMDLVMPEMEGTELLQWLSKQGIDVPVILMSGYNEWYVKAASIIGAKGGLSMLGTLKKPFSLDELENLLAQVLPGQDAAERPATG